MKNILFIIVSLFLLINVVQGKYYMLDVNRVNHRHYDFEIEIGDDLLVFTHDELDMNELDTSSIIPDTRLIFINKMKLCGSEERKTYQEIASNDLFTVLYKNYGYVIHQAKNKEVYNLLIKQNCNNKDVKLILPLVSGRTTLIKNLKPTHASRDNAYITALVNSINQTRLTSVVDGLAKFNRYSLGNDILNARDYIINHVRSINSNIPITSETFTVSGKTCYNVIATITGRTNTDKWYIVGAHYDSTSQSPTTSAPGAEDNASGSSGVLEILRAFNSNPPQQGTFIFIWYSGEEQGLYGSKANVQALINAGNKSKVVAALTHDMIGYRKSNFGVIIETSVNNNTLFAPVYSAALAFQSTLALRIDNNPFGSDHVSYLNAGIASTLAIDQDWGSYPYYHRTTDTADKLDYSLLNSITRLEAAALGIISGN
eukprot:TRINITY_DN1070_c0_g1_i1.p1 TRINITY_DN1070_c0_g1~~TRINITY_DN1070_c0_g1_i1.p1  ORF type:complete len:429 (-),score=131.31 TRINITY_DN1070_c0_g1_i1:68-1354(-)